MKKSVRIIGVPMDLGQVHRGVDMGPGAIRYAGLSKRLQQLEYEVSDSGNVSVQIRDTLPSNDRDTLQTAIHGACELIYDSAQAAAAKNAIPVFLGGDHSIAIGTIGGITDKRPCGVIWVDAHADYNTPETSLSGNIHGMALSILTGNGLKQLINIRRKGAKLLPTDVVMIGLRALDRDERTMLRKSGITVYTMRDIDEHGISAITHEALERLQHRDRIHVSLDMDGIDPAAAPGVGTPVPGGLTVREAHLLMEIIADSRKLCSMDIVEINPILDERNRTAILATQLAVSLLGKSII